MIDFVIDDRLRRFFWRKVNKRGPVIRPEIGSCWEWLGALRADGYGVRTTHLLNGKAQHRFVHRIAFALEHGHLPAEQLVLRHDCDNRKCVNPKHLLVGTHAQNSADMVARGRQSRGDAHYSRQRPEALARGDLVGTSKLTEDQARAVIAEYQPFKGEAKRLGEKYGVTNAEILNVVQGKQWVHLGAPPLASDPRKERPATKEEILALIEQKSRPAEGSDCLIWTGQIVNSYPVVHVNGERQSARRLLYSLHYDEAIPKDRVVLDTCRNKLCVNVEHLTYKDMMAPGEAVKRNAEHLFGSGHHKAKVTEEIVRQMRAEFATGQFTRQQIADKYGLKLPQTCAILNGNAWRHVA